MGGCESSEQAPASKAKGPQAAPVRSAPQGAGVAASPKVKQGKHDKDEKSSTLKMARKQGDWPWSRPEPPDTKTGGFRGQRSKRGDFFYSKEYLSSFKILSATEARAYEAYCNDNHTLARKILAEEACVPQDPVSPDDVDLDSFSPSAGSPRYSLGEGRVRGGSVAGEVTNTQALEASDGPRSERVPLSPHAANVVLQAVQNCPLFQHLSRNFGEHQIVVEEMKQLSLPAGDTVLVGGEYPRENRRGWYVVVTGKLHCAKGAHGATWTAKKKLVLGAGDSFGELLVTNVTSRSRLEVNVDSSTPATCYLLEAHTYQLLLSRIAHRRREAYKAQLQRVKVGEIRPFAQMKPGDLAQLADCLTERCYAPGEKLIKYGEPGTHAHIILKGVVEVIGRKNGETFKVCEFKEGEDPVGFLEFFDSNTAALTIADVVASHSCSSVITACIGREHFERCMGPIKELLKNAAATSNVYGYYREATRQK